MAIALFSSILLFSSRCRCSRNSRWISAYNPSLFFDGNRFVAFRIWRYKRSVERRDDGGRPPKFDMSSSSSSWCYYDTALFKAILFVDILLSTMYGKAFWVLRKTLSLKKKRKKKRHTPFLCTIIQKLLSLYLFLSSNRKRRRKTTSENGNVDHPVTVFFFFREGDSERERETHTHEIGFCFGRNAFFGARRRRRR